MTLVEFLTARLDEDEQLARTVEQNVGTERKGEPYSDGSGIAVGDAFPSYPWGAYDGELPFMAGPGHPSRVLADVAAKRAILALHPPETVEQFDGTEVNLEPPFRCDICWDPLSGDSAEWPCPTLLVLAGVYADHPDFDPAWRC